jgi:hypothetical protein
LAALLRHQIGHHLDKVVTAVFGEVEFRHDANDPSERPHRFDSVFEYHLGMRIGGEELQFEPGQFIEQTFTLQPGVSLIAIEPNSICRARVKAEQTIDDLVDCLDGFDGV